MPKTRTPKLTLTLTGTAQRMSALRAFLVDNLDNMNEEDGGYNKADIKFVEKLEDDLRILLGE